jgi:high mobility group protein B1
LLIFQTTNIAKLVSKAWGDLPPEKREKWDALARRDKTRYEMEKSKYTGPWKVPADRRALKDPNAPKRPMSAFLAFSNPRRGMVKQNNPEMDNSQISKALSRMWKDAPEQVRQKYINEEFTKRNRYKQVIMEWKKENDEQKRLDRQYQEDIALQAVDATEEQSTFAVTRTDSLRHQEDLNAAAYTITSYQPCEPMYQPFPSSRMGVYGNEDAGAIQSSGSAYCEQPGGVPGLSSTNHSLAHISNMLCRPQILSPFQQMQDSRSFLSKSATTLILFRISEETSLTYAHPLDPRSCRLINWDTPRAPFIVVESISVIYGGATTKSQLP